MSTLPEKIKIQRCTLGLSQNELGNLVGVSLRSVASYERGEKYPREKTIYQLAKALRVSIKYLKEDSCENPLEDIEKNPFVAEAAEQYGVKGARDVESLLAENAALFAGGELSQEEKDMYFEALMTAYVTCKEKAKKKYGRKKKD